MTPKILVTCGAGKISKALLPLLLKNGYDIRAFVHSEESGKKLQEALASSDNQGTLETFVGDLENPVDVRKAMANIDIVVHMGPSLHQREDGIGKLAIDEAKAAHVSHFILSSLIHPVCTKLPHHKLHIGIQEYLIESRLPYTILEPAHFMQTKAYEDIVKKGLLTLMCSFETIQGYLDLVDLAEVILKVIQNPQLHNRAKYELIGDNRTGHEVAQLISKHSGKEIKCEVVDIKKIKLRDRYPMLRGAAEFVEVGLEQMCLYYDRWGLPGNNNVLRFLLGREPSSFEDFVIRILKK